LETAEILLGAAEDVLGAAEDVLGVAEDVLVLGIALSASEIPKVPHGCMPYAPSEEAGVKLAVFDI